MWRKLKLVRIYTKPKGKLPDYEYVSCSFDRAFTPCRSPVVLRGGNNSVEDFCKSIHKTLIKEFKCALVWGSSAKHQPQRVGKDHILQDEDVVQIVKK
jgi:ribosome-interacting GTPase 1